MSSGLRHRGARILAIGAVAAATLPSLARMAHAGESLPDPTQPPATALAPVMIPEEKGKSDLELSAVFLAEDRRVAVVNGRRVGVADEIAGARVLAIEPGRVRLERAGEILELELVSPAFRRARERARREKPVSAGPVARPSGPLSDSPSDSPSDSQGARR